MTARIASVDVATAQGHVKELFEIVKSKFGNVPNALQVMGNSPVVLEGYLSLGNALKKGRLSAPIREQIALFVSQRNECEYCLSAHTLSSKFAPLKPDQILAARRGEASDPKAQAVLDVVKHALAHSGRVPDPILASARSAGVTDEELVEVVGAIAAITLTNLLNNLARPEVDFPKVSTTL